MMIYDLSKLKLDPEERAVTERSLRTHWRDESICMLELIRAKYNDDEKSLEKKNVASKSRIVNVVRESGIITEITSVVLYSSQQDDTDTRGSEGEYFVIIDYDLDLDWIVDDSLISELFKSVSSELTVVKSIPHRSLAPEYRLEFMRLLGNALVAAIENQREEAQKLLLAAKFFILNRLAEQSRLLTLITATIVLGITLLIYIGIVCSLDNYPDSLHGIVWGIAGAYLSVAFKAGKEQRDSEAGLCLHITNVIVRFSCASLLGAFGVLMLKNGKLFPQMINEMGMEANGAQFIGFLCGFCEKFIPNLIKALPQEK